MGFHPQSIFRYCLLYVGLPLILLVLIVVGWMSIQQIDTYLEERALRLETVAQVIAQLEYDDELNFAEMDAIRYEHLRELNVSLGRDMLLAVTVLALGVLVPVLVARHFSHVIATNLQLLEDHMQSFEDTGSSLMPRRFDFNEFGTVVATLRGILQQRMDAERRWRCAEQELVETNAELVKRAEELREGRRVALSMMEDAEYARVELEDINTRLGEVIEQARSAAHSADVANAAKSSFLATMSHEIRTPLNGVIGFIDMLSQSELNADQREYVHSLQTSSEALMALINDILDFSKIESGRIEFECRSINLVRLMRETVRLFFGDAAKKGVELKLDLTEGVPRVIRGDEARLRQILFNLLSNAVKFTDSGEILVVVNCVAPWKKGDQCEIEFEISDTGIGMSEEQVGRLFQPFLQADSSTTRQFGGTGLGLAICKRLSEAMGGRIGVRSRLNQGSCFSVHIQVEAVGDAATAAPFAQTVGGCDEVSGREVRVVPSADEAVAIELAKATEVVARSSLAIVVAEDNMVNQRLVQIMLKRLGLSAEFCVNGLRLLEYVREHPCDLIFMDLQMPEMDGLEATRAIRRGDAGEAMRDVKIIALTANALSSDQERCLLAGMDGYLSKPLKSDVLRSTVQEMFPAVFTE